MKELVQFVDSHPETIRKKVSIILQQFVNTSSKTIGGRGRGMVVVRSRYHCVLFQQEMVKQMKEMGLPYSCLVGFSGTIKYREKENTESSLNIENGFNGRIPDGMKDPRYRILIVSNKFQTGYDEPLLQSMYVDKRLSGVQCVQTLSRLNRTKTGKLETFVLDFVNDTEDIVDSFQPFYESTILTEETDPNILYDLVTEIEQYNLYTKYELDSFCKELYDDNSSVSKMENHINPIVDRYNQRLNDEEKDKYKSLIQSFIRLYSYISQISDFTEVHWEKTYLFLRMLNKKLPKGKFDKVSVYNDISLDSLRLQLIGQSKLELEPKIGELSPLYGSEGKGKEDEPYELLSQIIEKLNTVHGIELTEDDRVTLGRVMEIMKGDEELLKVFNGNNTDDVRKDFFEKILVETLVGYHDDRIDFYKKVMDKRVLPVLIQGLFQSYLQTVGR
jgi:type I restriction enzyme R subunit